MVSYMESEPTRRKIIVCYNLPLYLGYFKTFFQRVEPQIFGFVDLEWCLGVETPEHLAPWLQMVQALKGDVDAEPHESNTVGKVTGQLLKPLLDKDLRGFITRYVVTFSDAMKLTLEKHLKARLHRSGEQDEVVEVEDVDDEEEQSIRAKSREIKENLREKAREDSELHKRVSSRGRQRIRETLARLKNKGEQRREEGEDRWLVLINVKASKSSSNGGHFLSELEVMTGRDAAVEKPEVFSLGKSRAVSGRAALAATDLIKYLRRSRGRERLAMVFVSSQMAGLFIHFMKSVPDAWEALTAVCDCWVDLSAVCYNHQTSLWTSPGERAPPLFKALQNSDHDGVRLSQLRKAVLGSGHGNKGQQAGFRSHIMEELLWVTRRGRDRWLQRARAAEEGAAPFRCSERGDDALFAALSVGVTPEAVPRVVCVEAATSAESACARAVDPYGCCCDADDGALQTPGELWASVDSRFFARFAGADSPTVWCFRGKSAVQGCVSLTQALQEILAFLEAELRKWNKDKAVLVLASPETELPALLKACGDSGLRDRFCALVSGYIGLGRMTGGASTPDGGGGAASVLSEFESKGPSYAAAEVAKFLDEMAEPVCSPAAQGLLRRSLIPDFREGVHEVVLAQAVSAPVGGRRLVCKIRHGLGRHRERSNFSLVRDVATGIEIKETGVFTRFGGKIRLPWPNTLKVSLTTYST